MKTKTKRLSALLLAFVMVASLFTGQVLPALAAPEPVALWSLYSPRKTIYYARDEDTLATLIDEGFLYAESSTDFAAGKAVVAERFGTTFFAYANRNVYYDLTGPNETRGNLICGGEQYDPTLTPVPAIYASVANRYLAGPYTAAGGESFYYMDGPRSPDPMIQGIRGDLFLQGPETGSTKTDISVFYNAVTGEIIPLSAYIAPGGEVPAIDKPKYPGGGTSDPVSGISLDKGTMSIVVGATGTLVATVAPSTAPQTVTWTTSNSAAATVNSSGVVTAVATGTATITATAVGGRTATCYVTVTANTVTGISLDKTTMSLVVGGATGTLVATVVPSTAPQTVTWTTSNSSFATVVGGVVTARGVGTATITATAVGGMSTSCTVYVTAAPVQVLGPDVNGDYYKPTGTPNVYEVVVDSAGTSQQPDQKHVFDTDVNGNPLDGGNLVVKPKGNAWYTENPNGIYREINANGHPTSDTAGIWVGLDGKFGTTDDKPASRKSDNNWYADMGQNIFHDVTGPNKGKLVGGGWDNNPATNPVFPIFEKIGTGIYYVGPMKDNDGYDYYYGDPIGGNGTVDSDTAGLQKDDVVWYIGLDGSMTTTRPQYMPEGVIKVGDDFWQQIPGVGGGNIYGKVTVSPDGRTATPVLENGNKLIVDQSTAAPADKPTTADTRWFDVSDLSSSMVNPGNYDTNSDGYLNPAEYANYLNGIATAGTTTRSDLYDAGFLVVAYANANGTVTGWNGAGYENAAYALVITENAISGGASTRAAMQDRIDKWFNEQCPDNIRDAATGVIFAKDTISMSASATGMSVINPGGPSMAFALSAAEASMWTNRIFTDKTWTRSFYNSGAVWVVNAVNSAIVGENSGGTSFIRPAMWIKLTPRSYAVNDLAIGAASYDLNGDGLLNPAEYASYQAGITAAGKLTVDAIYEEGFRVVAYADNTGKILGWNGDKLGGAKYALIISNTAIEGGAVVRTQMQSKINTWFANTCPASIKNAAARVIFASEVVSMNASQTGMSKVDAGGDVMAFALSSAELSNYLTGGRIFAHKTWTRSTYNSGAVWVVNPNGDIAGENNGGSSYIRPAVWVEIG